MLYFVVDIKSEHATCITEYYFCAKILQIPLCPSQSRVFGNKSIPIQSQLSQLYARSGLKYAQINYDD